MSSATQSRWLAALGIIAALILVLFILGFWYAVYTPGVLPTCSGPFTLMGILTLILAITGVFLLTNYLGRGSVNDLMLIIFVTVLVIFTISVYLLSVSTYAQIC
ncbi:hypothetical protein [Vulcanisaeta souniana]|uniref:Uncharacterized protein n=1 Tax=Vulcanisaeta souniana JCM 11219 TaxID=1293586 RepID=A0A830EFT3_9CREN|nr:hypothetical protein [Vulcanisaeta souniana]BDR92189.1 hypothetical protein Vsou_12820 [Vulcanisaeta souniana JCM 11219]GGI67253.1 hypothetical protein GCM10007112_00270 [Vulcanisaeta souniana JCM 11219]